MGGAPTLLDVCSFLGMGREGESGEEREGGGAGCPVSGVCRLSVGLASCSFEGRTGEKLEKEVESEVGTLGVGLPGALRLTWGGCTRGGGAPLGGGSQQDNTEVEMCLDQINKSHL